MRIGMCLTSAVSLFASIATADARSATKVEQQAIQREMENQLTDPYTAHYTYDYINEINGIVEICGTVNAKNKMGGYVGKQLYVALFLKKVVGHLVIYDGSAEESIEFPPIRELCMHGKKTQD